MKTIKIAIEIFHKNGATGAHIEIQPFNKAEVSPGQSTLLSGIMKSIKDALDERSRCVENARIIECSGDSSINKELKKKFL